MRVILIFDIGQINDQGGGIVLCWLTRLSIGETA
jgi:hypothetical protein